ncbi:MAG: RING finger domain-containing protein, partial [bacterium]
MRNLETTDDERTIVEEYHNITSLLKAKRQATKKEQIRKLRVKLAALDEHGRSSSSTFSGETTSCAICLDDFEHGEECVRLNCRHIMHSKCMTEYTCMVLRDALADDARTTADCPQ